MSLLRCLSNNKGTISNALSKKLAEKVLDGDKNLLKEAIPLVVYKLNDKKLKHIRAGAASLVDAVAKEQPKMVIPYLEKLFPALDAGEPQTRWIILRVFGLCSEIKPEIVKKAIEYAKKYIFEKAKGQLCLVSSADMFLGEYGKLSKEATNEVFPILVESMNNVIKNEHDWIIESCIKMIPFLSNEQKKVVIEFTQKYENHPRKATRSRVKKINTLCK